MANVGLANAINKTVYLQKKPSNAETLPKIEPTHPGLGWGWLCCYPWANAVLALGVTLDSGGASRRGWGDYRRKIKKYFRESTANKPRETSSVEIETQAEDTFIYATLFYPLVGGIPQGGGEA